MRHLDRRLLLWTAARVRAAVSTSRVEEKRYTSSSANFQRQQQQRSEKFDPKLFVYGGTLLVGASYVVYSGFKESRRHAEPVKIHRKETKATDEPSTSAEPDVVKQEAVEDGEPNDWLAPDRFSYVPSRADFLVIGAGTAGYYAAVAIRAHNQDAKILLVGAEHELPYTRTPLSKEMLWRRHDDEDAIRELLEYKTASGKRRDVFYEPPGFYVPTAKLAEVEHGGVALLKGRRVVRLDVAAKTAYLEDGTKIGYDKALIATGSTPIDLLPALHSIRDLTYQFQTTADFRRLDAKLERNEIRRLAIVGGGLLGVELAYALRKRHPNVEIYQVTIDTSGGVLADILPPTLAHDAALRLRAQGVALRTGEQVQSARLSADGKAELTLTDSSIIGDVDAVLVAVGNRPDTTVQITGAERGDCRDEQEGGYRSDATLLVAPDVWVAGDACSFFDPALRRQRRLEHWEAAQVTGRLAGENMATGAGRPFWYEPGFYTALDDDYQLMGLGETDARKLQTHIVLADKQADKSAAPPRGVVFYERGDGRVVGVLLLNVVGAAVDAARRLIKDGEPIEDWREAAKLFELYDADDEDVGEDEAGQAKKDENAKTDSDDVKK